MSDFCVRAYRPEDAAELCAIYAHYVRESVCTFDVEAPDVAATAAKFAVLAERGHPLLVGEAGGRAVGYAYATRYRDRHGYRFTCEDTIYLAPGATGRGHGRLLLGAVIEAATAFGFKQMLAVIAGGTESSIRLHAHFGFETRGTFPRLGHKFGRWIDVVHMQKGL